MKQMKKISILLLALSLFACTQTIEVPPPSIQPRPAPEFDFNLLQGGHLSSHELKGKWIVLNVWATYCPPCVREAPDFIALQEEFAKKNVQFIGIAANKKGAETVESFVQRVGITYPVLLVNTVDVSAKFGEIDHIPTTFIIDPDWNLVNRHIGQVKQKVLRAELNQWLDSRKK
jgi:thiol-disulfide isomerase/thioredoxin